MEVVEIYDKSTKIVNGVLQDDIFPSASQESPATACWANTRPQIRWEVSKVVPRWGHKGRTESKELDSAAPWEGRRLTDPPWVMTDEQNKSDKT